MAVGCKHSFFKKHIKPAPLEYQTERIDSLVFGLNGLSRSGFMSPPSAKSYPLADGLGCKRSTPTSPHTDRTFMQCTINHIRCCYTDAALARSGRGVVMAAARDVICS